MSTRDRVLLIVIASVAAIVGGWMLVISPRRDQAAKLDSQVASTQAQLASLQGTLAQHQAARATFASSYTELSRLGEAVPAEDGVGSLLYQIQDAAQQSHVDFGSINVSSGPSAVPGAPTTARPPGTTPTSTTPGTSSGPAGFSSQNFSFTFTGDFFHLSSFFGRLQQLVAQNGNVLEVRGRLMALNSIQLQPGPHGFPQISANVTATTYSVPPAQVPLAASTPGAPLAASATPVGSPVPSAPPTAAITR